MTSAQHRARGGRPRVDRGAPIVDGPCKCRACGRKFVDLHALQQHTERVHFEPVKGPLIRFSGPSIGPGMSAFYALMESGRSR